MGVTAIKRITNNSTSNAVIRNAENPDRAGNGGTVPGRGGSILVDMWIPWATNSDEIPHHHIGVTLGSAAPSKIFQGHISGDDLVRIIPPGGAFPGRPIGGATRVDGNRHMRISSTGAISLEII